MLLFFIINIIIFTVIKTHKIVDLQFSNFDIQNIYSSIKNLTINNTNNIINITNYKNISKTEEKILLDNNQINIKSKNYSNIVNRESSIRNFNSDDFKKELKFLSSLSFDDKKFSEPKKLRFLQTFVCKDNSSCSFHGECNKMNTDCICESGFTTFFNLTDPFQDKKCNYEKKQQIKAFLFELFLGFGAGHFYTERFTVAGLKLGAFIFGICIICLFPITAKFLSEKLESDCLLLSVSCFYYLCSIGLAFWFIYDLVMFGMNKYLDGNGVELFSWSKNPEVVIN